MPGVRCPGGGWVPLLSQPAEYPDAGEETSAGVLGGDHWQRRCVRRQTYHDARPPFYRRQVYTLW